MENVGKRSIALLTGQPRPSSARPCCGAVVTAGSWFTRVPLPRRWSHSWPSYRRVRTRATGPPSSVTTLGTSPPPPRPRKQAPRRRPRSRSRPRPLHRQDYPARRHQRARRSWQGPGPEVKPSDRPTLGATAHHCHPVRSQRRAGLGNSTRRASVRSGHVQVGRAMARPARSQPDPRSARALGDQGQQPAVDEVPVPWQAGPRGPISPGARLRTPAARRTARDGSGPVRRPGDVQGRRGGVSRETSTIRRVDHHGDGLALGLQLDRRRPIVHELALGGHRLQSTRSPVSLPGPPWPRPALFCRRTSARCRKCRASAASGHRSRGRPPAGRPCSPEDPPRSPTAWESRRRWRPGALALDVHVQVSVEVGDVEELLEIVGDAFQAPRAPLGSGAARFVALALASSTPRRLRRRRRRLVRGGFSGSIVLRGGVALVERRLVRLGAVTHLACAAVSCTSVASPSVASVVPVISLCRSCCPLRCYRTS